MKQERTTQERFDKIITKLKDGVGFCKVCQEKIMLEECDCSVFWSHSLTSKHLMKLTDYYLDSIVQRRNMEIKNQNPAQQEKQKQISDQQIAEQQDSEENKYNQQRVNFMRLAKKQEKSEHKVQMVFCYLLLALGFKFDEIFSLTFSKFERIILRIRLNQIYPLWLEDYLVLKSNYFQGKYSNSAHIIRSEKRQTTIEDTMDAQEYKLISSCKKKGLEEIINFFQKLLKFSREQIIEITQIRKYKKTAKNNQEAVQETQNSNIDKKSQTSPMELFQNLKKQVEKKQNHEIDEQKIIKIE